MKITKKPAQYEIVLGEDDLSQLILALDYAYTYLSERSEQYKGNTRFVALRTELQGAR
jgi:hypothetical protein